MGRGDLDNKGGTYELSDINIRHFEVPPVQMQFDINESMDSVSLTVGGIGLRTDPFNFKFQKYVVHKSRFDSRCTHIFLSRVHFFCLRRNTFPKVHDDGKAVMILEDIGLEIILSVMEDPKTQVPQVDEVDVRIHVEDFRIDAIEGAHIKLYNKVFGLVRFVVRKVSVCTNADHRSSVAGHLTCSPFAFTWQSLFRL